MPPKKHTVWTQDLEIAMLVELVKQFAPRMIAESHWVEVAGMLDLGVKDPAEAVEQHWRRALKHGVLAKDGNGRYTFTNETTAAPATKKRKAMTEEEKAEKKRKREAAKDEAKEAKEAAKKVKGEDEITSKQEEGDELA